MSLAAEPFPDEPRVQAFRYGSIVLAGDLGAQGLTEELIFDHERARVERFGQEAGRVDRAG